MSDHPTHEEMLEEAERRERYNQEQEDQEQTQDGENE